MALRDLLVYLDQTDVSLVRLNLAVDAGGCVVRLLPVGANVAKLCIPLS